MGPLRRRKKNVYLWHRYMQSNCLPKHAHKPVSECLDTDTDIWHKKIDPHSLPYVHFRVYTQRSSNTLSHAPRQWQPVTDATHSNWTRRHFTCCFPVKGALPGAGGGGDHFAAEGEIEFPPSRGWHVTRPWQSNPDRIKRSAITQSWQAAASRRPRRMGRPLQRHQHREGDWKRDGRKGNGRGRGGRFLSDQKEKRKMS